MNKEYNFDASAMAPHIERKHNSNWIMQQVLIALLFPTVSAVYFFGWISLIYILLSIFLAYSFEYGYKKIRKNKSPMDLSSIITGWLLALCLPTTTPFWILIIGNFIAIILVKQIGGGIGNNLLNPAVTARVCLKLFFTPWITNWVLPGPDIVTTATPLPVIGHFARTVPEDVPPIGDLFLGLHLGGPMGETSVLALLLAFLFLTIRKIINPVFPLLYVGTAGVIFLIYSGNVHYMLTHLFTGSIMLAAVFMVTDYTTTPLTNKGMGVFMVGAGVITALARILFTLPGGVGISILVMNLLVPVIDKKTMNRTYGTITTF